MSEAPRTFSAHRWHPDANYFASYDIREWDASEDRSLRRYWARGLSTAVIGVKLGRSKNSIIGRARRLLLAPRPSPLNHGGKTDPYPDKAHTPPPQTPRAPKPWPPKPAQSPAPKRLSLAARTTMLRSAVFSPFDAEPAGREESTAEQERLKPAVAPAHSPQPAYRLCQFPTSDGRPWRFCEAPTTQGGPYCAHHRAICWQVPPRVRAEAA